MSNNIRISGAEGELIESLVAEVRKSVMGQNEVVFNIIAAMISNGNVLLEGPPGLAKTTLVKSLAEAVGGKFARVQFTPDLLPSDITGSFVYHPKTSEFSLRRGPIFANFILADEINRASAKVQSALLEAMQEQQVTIGENTYKLPYPFWVLATQNPIEQEGTYRLPEAQADRFLIKLKIDYPNIDDEVEIARHNLYKKKAKPTNVLTLDELQFLKESAEKIYINEKIEYYVANIVAATRPKAQNSVSRFIRFGASPRGTIALLSIARSVAFLNGRNYVIPEDVIAMAFDSLRHRIGLTFEALAENITIENIISEVLKFSKMP